MTLYCGQCLIEKRFRVADTIHDGKAYCATDYILVMRVVNAIDSDDEVQDILTELETRRPT